MKKILITGAAGFIGFHLSKKLCAQEWEVFGIDNLNNYYDVQLKLDRLTELKRSKNFHFQQIDLSDRKKFHSFWEDIRPNIVINLAAQAGVRYSIDNPYAYVQSNLDGFVNVLEGSRNYDVEHLLYASSSSVYGANKKIPFSESDSVDHPVSLYAATKKSNELMAHTYSHLYQIPTTGLRFFTVYGPYGRPDMAYFLFTKAIYEQKSINVFNNGNMERDFTYIDDIVSGISDLINKTPTNNPNWNFNNPDPSSSFAPYSIYNIGNNNPVKLNKFIELLEELIGKKAIKNFQPMQLGDVQTTYADTNKLANAIGFAPNTSIEEGLSQFVNWYKNYYQL